MCLQVNIFFLELSNHRYEDQSEITEPYLITLKSSKIDIYRDDIS